MTDATTELNKLYGVDLDRISAFDATVAVADKRGISFFSAQNLINKSVTFWSERLGTSTMQGAMIALHFAMDGHVMGEAD